MTLPRRSAPVLVLLLLLAGSAVAAGQRCERVVAVGDLHGGYRAFVEILRAAELVDDEFAWSGGEACLVQLGDVVDRGPRSRELLDLLMALQRQAPGRVEVLLGNHEVLTLLGDLRYTEPDEFAEFAADETEAERAAGFDQFRESAPPELDADQLRSEFERRFPPGWFARRRAFSADGTYGAWLLERPVAIRIGGSVFIHAGLTPEHVRDGLDALNRHVIAELREFLDCRRKLEASSWIPALAGYAESFQILHRRLERVATNGKTPDATESLVIAKYVAQLKASTVDSQGPLWYRGLANGNETERLADVMRLLALLDAERIVVAHTTAADGRIRKRFNGRVFVIDTGAGPAYAGGPSALEVVADGTVHAVYPDARELLTRPVLSDGAIEAALLGGRVLEIEEIGSGITRPKRVTLEYRGRRFRAAFKTVDIQQTGMTRFERSGTELNFTDNHRYERAAYLLDRRLGLNMVPVAVERTIDGEKGTLIQWIEEAFNEAERRERALDPPDPVRHKRQQDVMQLFDALILNDDRNLSNQLITSADWRLHLIDHSRSFRLTKKLPAAFEGDNPISLPRQLYEAMRGLELKPLRERLQGLLSAVQVKALLARRDQLVAKIERDVAAYGEPVVFHPDAATTVEASP